MNHDESTTATDVDNGQARPAPSRRGRRTATSPATIGMLVGAVALAVIVVLVVVLAVMRSSGGVGPQDPDQASAEGEKGGTDEDRGCVGDGPTGAERDYIEQWTESLDSIVPGGCVLQGRLGPEPQFDVTALGEEQPIDRDVEFDDVMVPTVDEFPDISLRGVPIDGYPAVHTGEGQFVTWRTRPGGFFTWCIPDGTCLTRSELDHVTGVQYAPDRDGFWLWSWVPPETSVVALEADNGTSVWQRPVARAAMLQVDYPRDVGSLDPDDRRVTVRYHAVDGAVLGEEVVEGPHG